MDNQPVTTRRAILIQDFDDGTYGERLFTGDRTPDTREKAARLKTGRLYPIPDDADIYAVVLTDGTCASSPHTARSRRRTRHVRPVRRRRDDGPLRLHPVRARHAACR